MPNWVYNYVSINGNKDEIQRFISQAKKEHPASFDEDKKELVYETDDLSFWNFIAPPQEAVESGEYFGTNGWVGGKKTGDTPNNWYNWNNKYWGCKWDSSDTEMEYDEKSPKSVVYRFQTPWSIPEPVFEAMVEQFPKLKFSFECEEETGWGAKYEGEKGDLTETESWAEPSCHSDYVERDNEDSCICANDDDKESWYDDCPDKETTYKVVVLQTIEVEITEMSAELAYEKALETYGDTAVISVFDETDKKVYPVI